MNARPFPLPAGRPRRRHALAVIAALFWSAGCGAADFETAVLGPRDAADVLVVQGSTSLRVFRGVLEDFGRRNPALRLVYTELPTQELYARQAAPGGRPGPADMPRADLVVSSSMDLQTKLVNDGRALPHISAQTRDLPAWANWRDEVFSIAVEALVMVYDPRQLGPGQVPRSRRELLSRLQDPAQPLAGRLATYDVRRSGIGYLAATQDARLDSMAGALLAAFGRSNVIVSDSSDNMLDLLAQGKAAMAYNVLDSYAQKRIDRGTPLRIVYPDDYTLVLSHAALIPRQARRPDLAARFLDYLLSREGQAVIASESGMRPVRSGAAPVPRARPVGLGVGLLVYQDPLKKAHFLDLWRAALRLD